MDDHGVLAILVTGATGYIGGRLVPRLVEAGHRVRILVRTPAKVSGAPWLDRVEVIQGSLDDADTVARACGGIDVLYYLVHSMTGHADFVAVESRMAGDVTRAAESAGVKRIVYLGGLHPRNVELSDHMASREAVGEIFLSSTIDAVVFQAGIIIGSGSASFEMIRHLADRLAVMIAPSWVRGRIEPIAVRDVLYYLVRAAEVESPAGGVYDVGSRDVMTYADAMKTYASAAGLARRRVVVVPIPAPWLAGLWVGLVTPIPVTLARPLVASLQHEAVAGDRAIDELIPPPEAGLSDFRQSVIRALDRERGGTVETSWAAAGGETTSEALLPTDPDWTGGKMYSDTRSREAAVDPARVWRIIEGIGGRNGWYSLPLAWKARGIMDKLAGGYGLRRGRLDRDHLSEGDPLDWWRVERIEPGVRLLLRAELRMGGRAWLELRADPIPGGTRYRQRAFFAPRGMAGRAYWWAVAPFHTVIFPMMSKNILRAAAALPTDRQP